jgi:hypothetical protein
MVSKAFGGGLATLHLRDLSAVSGRSPGKRVLHSKLHIPAFLAAHSAALAKRNAKQQVIYGHSALIRSDSLATFAAIRRASSLVSSLAADRRPLMLTAAAAFLDRGGAAA